jgi:hypothetical protein
MITLIALYLWSAGLKIVVEIDGMMTDGVAPSSFSLPVLAAADASEVAELSEDDAVVVNVNACVDKSGSTTD